MTTRQPPHRKTPPRPPMSSNDMQVLGTQFAALTAILVVALREAGVPINDAQQSTILSLLVTVWGIITTIYTIRHRIIDPPATRTPSRHRAPKPRPIPASPMTLNGKVPLTKVDTQDGDTGEIPQVDAPYRA